MAQSSAARCGVRGRGSMLPKEALWLSLSERGVALPNVELELALIFKEPFLKMAASGEFGDRPRSSATLKSKSKLFLFTSPSSTCSFIYNSYSFITLSL